MAKTEDIEAKLAAYVDGAIDDAGRAEIEKHLASNPQHRELLADLSRQRDLLRGLPRDMAPADIAESVNSQLERAVLLGDVDSGAETAGRIGYFSQLRAIAAMLLLTGGLAGVIYYLLPSVNRHNPELADLRIEAQPTTAPVVLATHDEPPAAPIADSLKPVETDVRPQIAISEDFVTRNGARGGGGGFGGGPGRLSMSNAMPPQQEIFSEALQTRAPVEKAALTPTTNPAAVYVVSSENIQTTARELGDYLRSNNISWDSEPTEPMPAPLNAAQQETALASRMQQATVQLKMGSIEKSQSEQRIVARQVTPEQASALKGWLGERQAQTRVSIETKDSNLIAVAPSTLPTGSNEKPPEIAAAALTGIAAPPPTTSPTTQQLTFGVGLNDLLDFAPARLDAPGIEFKSRQVDLFPENNKVIQPSTAPTTQSQQANSELSTLTPVVPLLAPPERMDVVIVLESPSPATQPAVIDQPLPAVEAPAQP